MIEINKILLSNNKINFILSGLFFWKLTLFFIYPFIPVDGPLILSHLFSILDGKLCSSTFTHSHLGDIFKTHVFEAILLPFFIILPTNTYAIIITNFFFILISILFLYKIFKNQNNGRYLFFLTTCFYLTSTYTYGMRNENYCIPFLLVMVLLFNQMKFNRSILFESLIGLLFCVVFFIHPVGGIFALVLIIYSIANDKLYKSIPILFFSIVFFSLLLTLGELESYIKFYYILFNSKANDHYFNWLVFPKYFTFSMAIIPLFILAFKNNLKQCLTFLLPLILLFINFGRSYYFHYLFILLIAFIKNLSKTDSVNINKIKLFNYITVCCLFFSITITHLSPTLIILENPTLISRFHQILTKVRTYRDILPEGGLLWSPPELSMEIIDLPNSRALYHSYVHELDNKKVQLLKDDEMIFYSKQKMERHLNKSIKNDRSKLIIERIIDPVPGELRIGKLYQERSDSIGLWSIRPSTIN